MAINIPNTFADKTGQVELAKLDENFTSIKTGVETEVSTFETTVNTSISGIQTTVNAIPDPVAMGLLFGPDPIPAVEPGSVIQTVQSVFNTTWGTSPANGTTFYPVTGFTATITPKYSSSKILVMLNMHCSSGYWEIQGRLTRNTADITESWGAARGLRTRCSFAVHTYSGGTSGYNWLPVAYQFLDSPTTTSATTYGVSLSGYSTYAIGVNYNVYTDNNDADYYGQPISTITLLEIAQ
jgi:hypothetical protein